MNERPRKSIGLRLPLLGAIALLFALGGIKINPGGPFISIVFDVIPMSVAIVVVFGAARQLRERSFYARTLAIVSLALATLTINWVARQILFFWMGANSRGDTIRFF